MGKVENISIALTEDLAAVVKAAVDSGDYASASEVVDDALRVWRDRRAQEQVEIERLRALVEEGIASGRSQFETIDEILAEAHRQYDARKA